MEIGTVLISLPKVLDWKVDVTRAMVEVVHSRSPGTLKWRLSFKFNIVARPHLMHIIDAAYCDRCSVVSMYVCWAHGRAVQNRVN